MLTCSRLGHTSELAVKLDRSPVPAAAAPLGRRGWGGGRGRRRHAPARVAVPPRTRRHLTRDGGELHRVGRFGTQLLTEEALVAAEGWTEHGHGQEPVVGN